MPISALPEGTVRRLGSTLAITSAVLLLKELLDNAIDAGATSVDVLVSSNTVDKIEVRDNGHGINPTDFDCLGRPGHTSKLRSFDELGTLGGATLGFRGAALASANALADISITTRVSTEHVATVVSLAKGGGVGAQRRVGAPIGTTVSVTGLFSHLPVRLQLAVKEAPRSLVKIKGLLQSYALTRPGLRLRLTVLKAPNLSWSYAPAPNVGVKEAAMQLFGAELAAQCTFRTFPSDKTPDNTGLSRSQPNLQHSAEQGPTFEALLPNPEAGPQKLAKGGFLSVDSRPISSTRGTGKRLLFIFKKHLGDHFTRARPGETLRDPFIVLNIRCPPGSYDVNVEPAKEDILFKEEQRVTDLFESFLSVFYTAPERRDSRQPRITAVQRDDEMPIEAAPELPVRPSAPQVSTPAWRIDMFSGVDAVSDNDNDGNDRYQERISERNEDDMFPTPEKDRLEDDSEAPSREGLNPWSIAKLTSRNPRTEPRPERTAQENHHETQSQPPERGVPEFTAASSLLTQEPHAREQLQSRHTRQGRREIASSTGGSLSFTQEPHSRAQCTRQGRGGNPASTGRRLQDILGNLSNRANSGSSWSSNRQTQSRRSLGMHSPPTSSPHEHEHDGGGPRDQSRPRRVSGPRGLVQSQISFDRNNHRHPRHNDADTDLAEQVLGTPRSARRTRASASTHHEVTDQTTTASTLLDPKHQRATLQPLPSLWPHNDGGASERQTYNPSDEQIRGENAQSGLSTDDPREHLIKLQRLAAQNSNKKPKRLKTEQLPLETVPRGFQTCILTLTVPVDTHALVRLISDEKHFDAWLVDGKLRDAFKNGTSPEDTAALVRPLLVRFRPGTTATA
ncbi:hypothetical protein N657DRAFT_629433 [Parathielavia appendiculata]|uniref:DNA mismatch repair protein S5 domain-containing protein n=1 Tax=Parathielavia appendiculata TaxID=2587402 RepID=A0AAN6U9D2_9PEZI|nr:hypothetical protein N657DRAFT_629433 [Parathielavia appendiculata]